MHVENKKNCTGCGACYNVCPKGAITMQGDEYGFYKPVIDKEKCISCGLCEKFCPLDKYVSNNLTEPMVFAFMNSDDVRKKSSSGGAFSAFADYILEQGGAVYGVIWDENIKAIHYRADKADCVEKMHGSKYVQSNTKDTFKQAKKDLESGKQVLYTGTPCQIAGLKSYLQKDYENLLTIDLICHGTQAPLFLEKYKEEFLKKKKGEKILNINFRSKKSPWGTGYFTTTTTTKDIYHIGKDYYTTCMDLTLNESCLDCRFTGIPRIADITIGDFWGVDEYDKSINDKKGLSVIILNSKKAEKYFFNIQNQYFSKEVPLDVVIKRNPNIIKSSVPHPKRKEFFEDIKNGKSLKICVKKFCKEPAYIVIYRILPKFIKNFIKYKILKREQ